MTPTTPRQPDNHPSAADPMTTTMPATTTVCRDWTSERLDRLARGMFPIVFGRPAPAPAPAPTNVVILASRRPCMPPSWRHLQAAGEAESVAVAPNQARGKRCWMASP